MITYFQRHMKGQTAFGVYSNIFDAGDRWACGGWYLAVNVWRYRVTLCGRD